MKGLKEKNIKTIVIVGLVVVFIIGTIIAGIVMFIKRDDIRGGFAYDLTPEAIMMGVKSNKNTFKVDDVNVELYYALYRNDEEGDTRKQGYRQEPTDKILFGLYISNVKDLNEKYKVHNDQDYIDYKEVKENIFIKEISEEDAFTEKNEYGYGKLFSHIIYEHNEMIKIPKEVLLEENGEIIIRIVSFTLPNEERSSYRSRKIAYLILSYEYIDENTVKLEFEDSSN